MSDADDPCSGETADHADRRRSIANGLVANTKTQRHQVITKPVNRKDPQTTRRTQEPSRTRDADRRRWQTDYGDISHRRKQSTSTSRVLNAETQSRGDAEDFPEEPSTRRDPGRQGRPGIAGSGNRPKNQLSSRFPDPAACATAQVSPPSSPFLQSREGVSEARQNRHAGGVPDGGKRGDSERWRLESPLFSPATGDRRSSVDLPTLMAPPHKLANQAFASLRLCVLCGSTMCTRDACTTMVVQPSRLHSGRAFAMASVFFCVFCGPLWLRRDRLR